MSQIKKVQELLCCRHCPSGACNNRQILLKMSASPTLIRDASVYRALVGGYTIERDNVDARRRYDVKCDELSHNSGMFIAPTKVIHTTEELEQYAVQIRKDADEKTLKKSNILSFTSGYGVIGVVCAITFLNVSYEFLSR